MKTKKRKHRNIKIKKEGTAMMNEKEKTKVMEKYGVDESQLEQENFTAENDEPETKEEVAPDE